MDITININNISFNISIGIDIGISIDINININSNVNIININISLCFPKGVLISCPPRACLPARNGLVNKVEFLGLIPQNGGRPMRLRDHYVKVQVASQVIDKMFEISQST